MTIVTRGRKPILEGEIADLVLEKLEATASRFATDVHAYCLMPDHVHLLIGIPDGISLQHVVRHFKQASGYALKQKLGTEPWQVSYYDRILRREESVATVAEYIWHNPVEAGLTTSPREYCLSGPREAVM